MQNETETKRNEAKQIETKRNKSKRNKTKRNETNDVVSNCWQKSVFSNIRKSFSNIRNGSSNLRKWISNSVFPQHCFSFKSARVISLSGVQLSGFIHLSHVKTAIFDIVFEVLILYSSFSLKIQITEWFMYIIKIPDLNTVLEVY